MAFDVNAATARYIDSLGPAALQKAHDYTVGKEWMLLWDLLVAGLVTWLIVRSGILDRLEAKIAERRRNLRAFVVTFVFFVISALLTLPWTIYESWWREKSYGRTSQPLGDFLGQSALAVDRLAPHRRLRDRRLLADAALGAVAGGSGRAD